MDMGMGDTCKISMLWNWYTVNACFISSQWQVTSNGYFAGTCIGVICLTMCLPFLRRLHEAYDSYVRRTCLNSKANTRPSVLQQTVRALLHTLQFAVAYFVMLLAMYYNGYIIISILIGAFLGYFIFNWPKAEMWANCCMISYQAIANAFSVESAKEDATEVTGCCG